MTFSQVFQFFSQLLHDLFIWALLLHDLFIWALLLHDLFTISSRLVQHWFPTFTICSQLSKLGQTCSWLFYNFFIIFSQPVHNSLRTCSFVHYFFMTCSQLVHILYLSCPVSTTCSHLCHNFSKILSSYFHKSVFVWFPKFKITLILILKRARYCQA